MTIKHLFPPAWPKVDFNFAAERSLDPRITFTRDSIGSYVDAQGIIRYAAENEPRFDHDPETGESLGLLIEEARTNTLENSDLSGLKAWNCSLEDSTEINPEGKASCKRIISDSGPHSEGHRITKQNSGTNTNNTMSVFVKMDTHPYVLIGSGAIVNGYTAAFNIDPAFTGDRLLGQSGKGSHTNIDAGYESYPNGWFRIWASGTTTGTDGWGLTLSPDGDTLTITDWDAEGTEAIFVYGGQAEEDARFPTSYIPTSGAAVDRSVDLVEIDGDNFTSFFNYGDHTTVVEWSREEINQRGWAYRYMAGPNKPNEFLEQLEVRDNNTVGASTWYGHASFGTKNLSGVGKCKAALAVTNRDPSFAVNGILGIRRDRGVSSGLTYRMIIGGNYPLDYVWNGHIGRIAYYPLRLSDEQLVALTS